MKTSNTLKTKKNVVPQLNGGNDECYTPDYGVKPILQFVPKNKTVWCPFDTEDSQFVKLLRENGNNVIYSHISMGQDFFEYEPNEHYDLIISNPPFSDKNRILERLLKLEKPFAMILPHSTIADGGIYKLFNNYDKELQLLLFDRRMEFFQADGGNNGKISFKAIYYCHNFLPKQMILAELPKPNIRRDKNRTDLSFHFNVNNSTFSNKNEGVA